MMRHTAASFLLAATGNLKLTAEQLAQSPLQTTASIYTHLNDAQRLASAEVRSEPFASILPNTPLTD